MTEIEPVPESDCVVDVAGAGLGLELVEAVGKANGALRPDVEQNRPRGQVLESELAPTPEILDLTLAAGGLAPDLHTAQ